MYVLVCLISVTPSENILIMYIIRKYMNMKGKNVVIFDSAFENGNVVMGTCRPYMSSLKYCNQTKYDNKQTLFWNLMCLIDVLYSTLLRKQPQ
jgi:hypothetical protein